MFFFIGSGGNCLFHYCIGKENIIEERERERGGEASGGGKTTGRWPELESTNAG